MSLLGFASAVVRSVSRDNAAHYRGLKKQEKKIRHRAYIFASPACRNIARYEARHTRRRGWITIQRGTEARSDAIYRTSHQSEINVPLARYRLFVLQSRPEWSSYIIDVTTYVSKSPGRG